MQVSLFAVVNDGSRDGNSFVQRLIADVYNGVCVNWVFAVWFALFFDSVLPSGQQ